VTHKHHILPRHAGGTNDPDNIIVLTVTQHAMYHFANWQLWGRVEDKIAWRGLSGIISHEDAVRETNSLGGRKGGSLGGKNQPREVKVSNCNKMRKYLTPEALSRGGKNMSPEQRRKNGLTTAEKTSRRVVLTSPEGVESEAKSVAAAAELIGCKPASLVNVLKGKRSQVWKWTARYAV